MKTGREPSTFAMAQTKERAVTVLVADRYHHQIVVADNETGAQTGVHWSSFWSDYPGQTPVEGQIGTLVVREDGRYLGLRVDTSTRATLLTYLRQRAYRRGKFVLASGKTSDFFIDCKRVILTAGGHSLAGTVFFETLTKCAAEGLQVYAVAAVALGGCPLASAVSLVSSSAKIPLDALYVRKEPKGHGTGSTIEGMAGMGAPVALLEDVLTTGASSLRAIKQLQKAGWPVPLAVALVDREEGGADMLRAQGIRVESIFTRRDFVRPMP